MELTGIERLNHLLDRLPRDTVHLGARAVPAFRSLGILGYHLALLTAMLTGFRAGVPLLDPVGLSATAAVSFFAWALLRRALTGRETLVLLEHMWVAIGAVTLYLWATGGPVVPGLDVLAVGLCVFLAFGRLGCLTAGCCHGCPAGLGVIYPATAGLPDRLTGVRLFPVQLLEAVALLAIGVVGIMLAGSRPGAATVWVLASYATIRFGTEALRGDRRPTVAGVSVPRAIAVAQLVAAVLASEAWLIRGGLGRGYVVAALPPVVVAVAGLLLALRRRDPLAAPAHLDEVWSRIRALARTAPAGAHQPATAATSQDVLLAASWGDLGLHVSFSHPSRPVDGLPYAFGLVPLARTAIATHVVVSATRVGPAPKPSDFPRRPGPDGARGAHDPSGRLAVGAASSERPGEGYFGELPCT